MGKILGSWSGMRKYLEQKMIAKYRNQTIKESINSDNPLERMFAILDRRLGKRTLLSIKETLDEQPNWLQFFYNLRLESEHI